eukprot:scaffold2869_cov408-Pavlova_lutheri.AAC.4
MESVRVGRYRRLVDAEPNLVLGTVRVPRNPSRSISHTPPTDRVHPISERPRERGPRDVDGGKIESLGRKEKNRRSDQGLLGRTRPSSHLRHEAQFPG